MKLFMKIPGDGTTVGRVQRQNYGILRDVVVQDKSVTPEYQSVELHEKVLLLVAVQGYHGSRHAVFLQDFPGHDHKFWQGGIFVPPFETIG